MSDSIMQSHFLVDLSTEQEATIAGGYDFASIGDINLKDVVKSGFSQEKLGSISSVKSGPGGSEVSRVIAVDKTKTFAQELFGIKF